MNLLLILFHLLIPATVKSMGYCPDVSNPNCIVRDWWPRGDLNAVGREVYWLEDNNNRVCFVSMHDYDRAQIGASWDCYWRERRP